MPATKRIYKLYEDVQVPADAICWACKEPGPTVGVGSSEVERFLHSRCKGFVSDLNAGKVDLVEKIGRFNVDEIDRLYTRQRTGGRKLKEYPYQELISREEWDYLYSLYLGGQHLSLIHI